MSLPAYLQPFTVENEEKEIDPNLLYQHLKSGEYDIEAEEHALTKLLRTLK